MRCEIIALSFSVSLSFFFAAYIPRSHTRAYTRACICVFLFVMMHYKQDSKKIARLVHTRWKYRKERDIASSLYYELFIWKADCFKNSVQVETAS